MPLPPLDSAAALFLDIDGTLLDIAARPELVRIPPGLPALLDRLAAQRQGALALVSGRSLVQIERLLPTWSGAAAGLHGAERRHADGSRVGANNCPADQQAAASLAMMRPALVAVTNDLAGVVIEDKGSTIAMHYRAAPNRAAELGRRVDDLLCEHGKGLRLIAGKMVFELQPAHHGKDGAIAAFMGERPFIGRLPVFAGDDTTDEDGFAEINRRGGLSIRVGTANVETAAQYALPSVASLYDWLRAGVAE